MASRNRIQGYETPGQITSIGWFLYDEKNKMVCLHRRDPWGVSPNTWDHFGGGVKSQTGETAYEAFLRELCEELGITVDNDKVKELCEYKNKKMYLVSFPIKRRKEIRLGEGAGFAYFSPDKALGLENLTLAARNGLKIIIRRQ